MTLTRVAFPLVVFMILVTACTNPCASCRIGAFVGKDIDSFMKDSSLSPKAVLEEKGGRTYVFEVNCIENVSVPPEGPIKPQNLGNGVPPVELYPGKANPWAWEAPRVAPGTPEPGVLRSASVVKTRILRVKVGLDGTIHEFAYTDF